MKHRAPHPYGNARIYSGRPNPEGDKVLVVNGFSESITHAKPFVRALSKLGYNALTFSSPRHSGEKDDDPIDIQSDIIQQMLEALPEGEQIDAVAHSLGAAATLRAAQAMPERFRSITLLQPVGAVDGQGFLDLAKGASTKVLKNQMGALRGEDEFQSAKPESSIGLTRTRLKRFARVATAQIAGGFNLSENPRLAAREIAAVLDYDLATDVNNVDSSIPIHVIKSNSDELFDTVKMDEKYPEFADRVTYSSNADQHARHDSSWLQSLRTARIVDSFIRKSK